MVNYDKLPSLKFLSYICLNVVACFKNCFALLISLANLLKSSPSNSGICDNYFDIIILYI